MTDRGLEAAGIVAEVIGPLDSAPVIFTGVHPNPTESPSVGLLFVSQGHVACSGV